jgi:acetyltransferase-like isoleucine patch superfamily enzyme
VPSTSDWKRRAWHLRWRTAPRLASAARIRIARLSHGHCRVVIPDSVFAGPGFRLEIPGSGSLIVGERVQFRRLFYCEIAAEGELTIGAGSIFTGETMIQCTTRISIGERCVFGQSAFLADGAHRFRDWSQHLLDQGYAYRPLTIEDNAVVHSKATIVADLGFRSVVGANSFVNKPVPAYTLVGGVPAKVLEYFGPPAEGDNDPA